MGCIRAPLAGSMSIWTSVSILNTLDPVKVFIMGLPKMTPGMNTKTVAKVFILGLF